MSDHEEAAMRLTNKDVIATLLVAAVVVPYIGYLINGSMPFIEDARGMGATGLVLGVAAAIVAGRGAIDADADHRAALSCGVVAFVLGLATVWAETNEILLGFFIVSIVATWALGEYAAHHAPLDTGRPMARSS
jgi:hypothetical protein